jgi:uncharacterized membrane protein
VPFPGTRSTGASRINNVGQIVGTYFDDNTTGGFPNGHPHGFLYDNGVFSSFDFPGSTTTSFFDINDHGTIVGIYGDDNFVGHSFILDHGTFTTFVVPFPNVTGTALRGINNRGQLVGNHAERVSSPSNQVFRRGFIATPQEQSPTQSDIPIGE